jgi:hypothetical protein
LILLGSPVGCLVGWGVGGWGVRLVGRWVGR